MNLLSETSGCVIVPAYLTDDLSILLLKKSLNDLPEFNGSIIVAAQGSDKILADYKKSIKKNNFISVEFKNKIGKWPAFKICLNKYCNNEQWIAVFDGDNSFFGKDLESLIKPIIIDKIDHVIGKRKKIILGSIDQLSRYSRLYVEAFFNTLTLILLKKEKSKKYFEFDIQCGFQMFSSKIMKRIIDKKLPYYGGELKLFYETIINGGKVANINISVKKGGKSSYSISEIIKEIIDLEFIKQATKSDFEKALRITQILYGNWFKDKDNFKREISELIHYWN